MRKYDMISGLAEYTAKDVVRNEENWRKYLNTASRLYKYSFKDQLLIYAKYTAFWNKVLREQKGK